MRRRLPSPLPVALFSLALAACGDDASNGTGGGDQAGAVSSSSTGCDGVVEDGECVVACTPEACLPGNTCVGNRCTLTCSGHDDCSPGSSCADSVEDGSGAAIKTCQPTAKAPILGAICYFGNECDAATVCPDGTACGASLCGGAPCGADGLCPDAVTACVAQACDAAACRPPRCLGAVPEPEQSPSASSYCTQDDCTADGDCAPGMYCGVTRDTRKICGNDDLELGLDDPCLEPDDFETDGKTYREGPVSLLRNTCIYRRHCAPCGDDLDCSGIPGQLCAQIGGEARCATTCTKDADCENDAACLEDPSHPGVSVCSPRYGSCTGEGEFCSPCINDLDCGDADTSMMCYPLAGAQRGCFDYSFATDCTTDEDCPLSVDGESRGECLDSGEQVTSSDPAYQKCFLPYFPVTNRFQCW